MTYNFKDKAGQCSTGLPHYKREQAQEEGVHNESLWPHAISEPESTGMHHASIDKRKTRVA